MARTKEPRFEFVIKYDSGLTKIKGLSLAEAHAKLGEFAGQNELAVHVHPGQWGVGAYSVAYTGSDPLLGIKALVRLQS